MRVGNAAGTSELDFVEEKRILWPVWEDTVPGDQTIQPQVKDLLRDVLKPRGGVHGDPEHEQLLDK